MKKLYYFSKLTFALALLTSFTFAFTSCYYEEMDDDSDIDSESDLTEDYNKPKYIFLFLGDGMANVQINATEAALYNPDFLKSVGIGTLNIHKFNVTGMQTTYSNDRYITDSAAAGTALATGNKTNVGTISQNSDNEDVQTIAERAKEKGMKVGIISSVSIDHATPACFYAHSSSREYYNYIANQMASSNFDFFGGGYAKGNFDSYKSSSKNPSGYEPVDVEEVMTNAGYTITRSKSELDAVSAGRKVWAYSEDTYDGVAALPYEIDRNEDDMSLAYYTQKGIELLTNQKGFFMMVEGGKIDWACHANDAVSATMEVYAFDQAIGKAIEFYNEHPDSTLIIVTGDHETGGLALGYTGTKYESSFTLLNKQTISFDKYRARVVSKWNQNTTFEEALTSAKEYFGLGDASITNKATGSNTSYSLALSEYETERLHEAFDLSISGENLEGYDAVLYGDGGQDPFTVTVTHILNQKAGLDWTSYYHTGVPVPVFVMGQGQYKFTGYYDNTDIPKKIMEIGKLIILE